MKFLGRCAVAYGSLALASAAIVWAAHEKATRLGDLFAVFDCD